MILTVKQLQDYNCDKKLFALIGYPIGHSMSRFIHSKLFCEDFYNAEYVLIETKPEELADCVRLLKKKVNGFNITIPYKTDIITYLDFIDEKAALYGAVNTVSIRDGKLYGYNTDCEGFVSSLNKSDISLSGKKTLLLGAGGVARMIAFEAVIFGAFLTIAAREIEKAGELAQHVASKTGKQIETALLSGLNCGYDVIINATPVGMSGKDSGSPVDFDVLNGCEAVYDTIYNPLKTPLIKKAEELNIKTENGLYMLVSQAAAAQTIWTGRKFTLNQLKYIAKLTAARLKIGAKNIVLTGFMGSGKTSVGRELAKRLDFGFLDMDKEIEKIENMNINEIFSAKGEPYFRELEHKLCQSIKDNSQTVISTGGGVILGSDNIKALKENGILIYLDLLQENILKRLEKDNTRPMLCGDRRERVSELYNQRLPLYKATADIIADASGDINTVTENILDKLG